MAVQKMAEEVALDIDRLAKLESKPVDKLKFHNFLSEYGIYEILKEQDIELDEILEFESSMERETEFNMSHQIHCAEKPESVEHQNINFKVKNQVRSAVQNYNHAIMANNRPTSNNLKDCKSSPMAREALMTKTKNTEKNLNTFGNLKGREVHEHFVIESNIQKVIRCTTPRKVPCTGQCKSVDYRVNKSKERLPDERFVANNHFLIANNQHTREKPIEGNTNVNISEEYQPVKIFAQENHILIANNRHTCKKVMNGKVNANNPEERQPDQSLVQNNDHVSFVNEHQACKKEIKGKANINNSEERQPDESFVDNNNHVLISSNHHTCKDSIKNKSLGTNLEKQDYLRDLWKIKQNTLDNPERKWKVDYGGIPKSDINTRQLGVNPHQIGVLISNSDFLRHCEMVKEGLKRPVVKQFPVRENRRCVSQLSDDTGYDTDSCDRLKEPSASSGNPDSNCTRIGIESGSVHTDGFAREKQMGTNVEKLMETSLILKDLSRQTDKIVNRAKNINDIIDKFDSKSGC